VARAAGAIGLRHGPIHAECRVSGTRVFVLEVAARPIGGLCARSLRFESLRSAQGRCASPLAPADGAIGLEELLLRHALGESPAWYTREAAASGVMMIPIPRRGVLRRVDGICSAGAVPQIVDIRITAKLDQMLIPLPEGASYLGFIFARAERPEIVEHALREAQARLTFTIDSEFPVLRTGQSRYNQRHG
jgi:L-amino acid ligase C-terminal domain 2